MVTVCLKLLQIKLILMQGIEFPQLHGAEIQYNLQIRSTIIFILERSQCGRYQTIHGSCHSYVTCLQVCSTWVLVKEYTVTHAIFQEVFVKKRISNNTVALAFQ